MTATRRLAAILSVDIAGYSRLKGRFRRILPVASRSDEGLLTDPIAGAQPAGRNASSFRSASGDPFLM